jgi:arylsulfatase A-like enzyme
VTGPGSKQSREKKVFPPETHGSFRKKALQCLGIAAILLVVNYGELLGGGAAVRMHVPERLTGICLAHIADILLVAAVLFAVIAPFLRTKLYPWVRLVLAILLPPYVIVRTQSQYGSLQFDGMATVALVVWAATLLLLRLRFMRAYRETMRFASGVAVFLGVFGICCLLQLAYVATWKPGLQQRTATWENAAQPPRVHPRVVWVIFDELSYDQVFEHRARDLRMPYFDALRAQSTVFTNAQPSGYFTKRIVPSLLTGRMVEDFSYSFDNRLKVHYAGVHGMHPLDGSETIFADAQRQGYRTAAVGWYNPYCTIYGDAIDQCYWTNHDRTDGPMAQSTPFQRNLWRPLEQMVREAHSPAKADRDFCSYEVNRRYETHKDLESHALEVLKTDQADFIFLHLAIPHSPNIWSRIRDAYQLTCDSSYLDNLALVDRVLGRFLDILQASPRWKDTTLVVQGDHSWRVDAWNWLPAWTEEDDAASGGVFDPRPALLVHAAGQEQPAMVTTPWPLIDIHKVLEQAVHGQAPDFRQ